MRRPAAKSLILDLLGTLRRGSAMPVAALIEAGALFDLAGNAVRVAVARLMADGHVVRDERGRYRCGEGVSTVGRHVRSWRHMDRRTRRWRGGWLGVHEIDAGRTAGQARRQGLRMFGFARLAPALSVRPDNLSQPLDAVRGDLIALGLPAGDLVFRLEDLDAAAEGRARGLWDTAGLREAYRRSLADLDASARRLPRLDAGDAMVESFLLGGRVVRELVLDPLLPEEICPTTERRSLVDRMRDYDRVGRLAWAEFLKRHDVPYLRAPLDTRPDSDAVRLAG